MLLRPYVSCFGRNRAVVNRTRPADGLRDDNESHKRAHNAQHRRVLLTNSKALIKHLTKRSLGMA